MKVYLIKNTNKLQEIPLQLFKQCEVAYAKIKKTKKKLKPMKKE